MAQNISLGQDAFGWADAFTKAFAVGSNAAIQRRQQQLAEDKFGEEQSRFAQGTARADAAQARLDAAQSGGSGGAGQGKSGAPRDFGDTSLSKEAKTLLSTIGATESGQRYDVVYGGPSAGLITNFADHPRRYFDGPAGPTSAAGRYQFVASTWDRTRNQFNRTPAGRADPITDFSPRNQDRGAWFLAQRDYALRSGRNLAADVQNNEFNPRFLNKTWTSFPGGVEGSRASGIALERWNQTYEKFRGQFLDGASGASVPSAKASQTTPETPPGEKQKPPEQFGPPDPNAGKPPGVPPRMGSDSGFNPPDTPTPPQSLLGVPPPTTFDRPAPLSVPGAGMGGTDPGVLQPPGVQPPSWSSTLRDGPQRRDRRVFAPGGTTDEQDPNDPYLNLPM